MPATWGGGGIAPAAKLHRRVSGTLELYYTGLAGSCTNLVGVPSMASTSLTGLNNRTSTYGQLLQLGNVNAGDVLVFFVDVTDTSLRYYTNPQPQPRSGQSRLGAGLCGRSRGSGRHQYRFRRPGHSG